MLEHEHPDFLWRTPDPKPSYDVIIVGAGGHGLATAYYLAKRHGITDVAVLERGWLGGGNMGRNTTIIRSNYLWDESAAIYEHSLKLWEGLAEELDYDLLFSQRGVLNLAHNLARRARGRPARAREPAQRRRRGLARRRRRRGGLPDRRHVGRRRATRCSARPTSRAAGSRSTTTSPGATRAAADALGVDLIQGCEVTGLLLDGDRIEGVETSRGTIRAGRVALAAAGHSSVLAAMAGLRLPVQTHPLQALVSELLEQVLDCVVMSNAVHVYVSQAHKGELVMGAGIDAYNGYGQRGGVHVIEAQMSAALELFPIFARAHVLRTWGGIVDVTPDASPIVGLTPIDGLYLNCGWGTGGFKGTPGSGWVYAHTIAHDEPHPLNAPFALDRFATGALIDEHGAAAVAH